MQLNKSSTLEKNLYKIYKVSAHMAVINSVEAEAARFIQDFSKQLPKAALEDFAAAFIGQQTNSLIKTAISYAKKANSVAITIFNGDIASTVIYLDKSKTDLIQSLRRISHLSPRDFAYYYLLYCLKVGTVGCVSDFLKKWTLPSIGNAAKAASEPDSPFDDITLMNFIKALGGAILPKMVPCDELTRRKQDAKRIQLHENEFTLVDIHGSEVTESTVTVDYQTAQMDVEEDDTDWCVVKEDPFS